MIKNTEIDKAYIAGIIDGEGSIFIGKHSINKSIKKYHFLRVSVINRDKKMVVFLSDRYGGFNKPFRDKHGRVYYQWVLSNKAASKFLIDILPYLLTKREQALVGLEFQKEAGTVGKRLTNERVDRREKLYLLSKSLKVQINKNTII